MKYINMRVRAYLRTLEQCLSERCPFHSIVINHEGALHAGNVTFVTSLRFRYSIAQVTRFRD